MSEPRLPEPVGSESEGLASRFAEGRNEEPLLRTLIGEQLRNLRHDRGETLRTVARSAAVSSQYLSELERGTKEPSSEMLAAIGAALDTTLLELISAVGTRLAGATPGALSSGDVALAA